jgi:hypothetical protein
MKCNTIKNIHSWYHTLQHIEHNYLKVFCISRWVTGTGSGYACGHVRKQIEYKGLFLNSDRVTRVTRLGYGIRLKMAEKGAFSKVVLKRVHFRKFWQKLRKKGYILSSQNLKRVPFSPPVTTRKESHFENRFLTWVPTLTPSDPPGCMMNTGYLGTIWLTGRVLGSNLIDRSRDQWRHEPRPFY